MTSTHERILNEGEAAKLLSLSPRTLQRLRLDGGGPAFIRLTEHRIGYAVTALESWIAERSAASTSTPPAGRRGAAA